MLALLDCARFIESAWLLGPKAFHFSKPWTQTLV
jgi:hypothetical protein